MRQAMPPGHRIGGATFVAVGAALVLTLPASAHTHTDSASVWTARRCWTSR